MGGRGSSSASNQQAATFTAAERELMLNALNRKSGKRAIPQSSRTAFDYNFREAKSHIETWGYDDSVFSSLNYSRAGQTIGVSSSTKTLNDILELANRRDKRSSTDFRLGIIDNREFLLEVQATQMVRGTAQSIIEKKRRGEW